MLNHIHSQITIDVCYSRVDVYKIVASTQEDELHMLSYTLDLMYDLS